MLTWRVILNSPLEPKHTAAMFSFTALTIRQTGKLTSV